MDTKIDFREVLIHSNAQVIKQGLFTSDDTDAHYSKLVKIAETLIAIDRNDADICVLLSKISEEKDDLLACGLGVMKECVNEAKRRIAESRSGRIVQPAQMMEKLEHHYDNGFDSGKGVIAWPNFSTHFRLSGGEMNVLTGIPNHGKSEWLDALLLNHVIENGLKVAYYSPENNPLEFHIQKLLEKITGKPMLQGPNERMSKIEMSETAAFMDQHYRFIELGEANLSLDSILGMFSESIKKCDTTCVVLDPWNDIEHARPAEMNETEYIGSCLSKCRRFARGNNVSLWIVAHPQKLQKDREEKTRPCPTPYDISGSANWFNKADNCFAVYRKEDRVEVHVQKIRFKMRGKVGQVDFTYNRISGTYTEMETDTTTLPGGF
jgi:twinkle protein